MLEVIRKRRSEREFLPAKSPEPHRDDEFDPGKIHYEEFGKKKVS